MLVKIPIFFRRIDVELCVSDVAPNTQDSTVTFPILIPEAVIATERAKKLRIKKNSKKAKGKTIKKDMTVEGREDRLKQELSCQPVVSKDSVIEEFGSCTPDRQLLIINEKITQLIKRLEKEIYGMYELEKYPSLQDKEMLISTHTSLFLYNFNKECTRKIQALEGKVFELGSNNDIMRRIEIKFYDDLYGEFEIKMKMELDYYDQNKFMYRMLHSRPLKRAKIQYKARVIASR